MLTVADDFSWADIGEVEWIEEKDDILLSEIGKLESCEGVVWKNSKGREFRCQLSWC